MFDSHTHKYWPDEMNVSISEKRAPTDDSIRLFMEMREKTIGSILASGMIPGEACLLRWVVVHLPEWHGFVVKFVVSVNEKEHEGSFSMRRSDLMIAGGPEAVGNLIGDRLRDEMARIVRAALESVLTRDAGRDIVEAWAKYDQRIKG